MPSIKQFPQHMWVIALLLVREFFIFYFFWTEKQSFLSLGPGWAAFWELIFERVPKLDFRRYHQIKLFIKSLVLYVCWGVILEIGTLKNVQKSALDFLKNLKSIFQSSAEEELENYSFVFLCLQLIWYVLFEGHIWFFLLVVLIFFCKLRLIIS